MGKPGKTDTNKPETYSKYSKSDYRDRGERPEGYNKYNSTREHDSRPRSSNQFVANSPLELTCVLPNHLLVLKTEYSELQDFKKRYIALLELNQSHEMQTMKTQLTDLDNKVKQLLGTENLTVSTQLVSTSVAPQ